jgi:carbon-monoxide dehydrogenase medium subunit
LRPASFAYFRPDSLDEAVGLLRANEGQALPLAGGQSLVQLLNRRAVRPAALVDLTAVDGLRHVTRDGNALRIGALTRHADLETATDPGLGDGFAVLQESARLVAQHPVRTRGTFGGSIAHADPCAEWCLLALVLDAEITALGPDGSRVVDVADFFLGSHRTALSYDEIITEVRIPRGVRHSALREFSIRQGDYAVVAAAVAVELDGLVITSARIALGGVADRPLLLPDVAESLVGAVPDEDVLRQLSRTVAEAVNPPGNVHGGPEYRRQLAATLTVRALREAVHKGEQA